MQLHLYSRPEWCLAGIYWLENWNAFLCKHECTKLLISQPTIAKIYFATLNLSGLHRPSIVAVGAVQTVLSKLCSAPDCRSFLSSAMYCKRSSSVLLDYPRCGTFAYDPPEIKQIDAESWKHLFYLKRTHISSILFVIVAEEVDSLTSNISILHFQWLIFI